MVDLGYNYRLSDIHSARLSQLRRWIASCGRGEAWPAYHAAFMGPDFITPVERPYVQSAWHLYTLQLADARLRRRVVEALHAVGIGVQVHYLPIYRHPYYRRIGYAGCSCPNAERYYSRCLSLPLYPGLSVAQQQRTIDAVLHIVGQAGRQVRGTIV